MNILILPVIIPLVFAVITGLVKTSFHQKKIILCGFILHFLISGCLLWKCRLGAIETVSIGNWLPPYGILLLADLFSSFFLFAISLIFLAANLYALEEAEEHPVHFLRASLIFILLAGISLSLLTADFFNLFVSFEMMLAASYALVTLEMANKDLRWAFSYLFVNLIGTLGFLCGAAMIYGHTGQLNMAFIASLFKGENENTFVLGWAYLLLGVFGLKAGLFPLFFWLPGTYASLPTYLAALFSGSLTKVGIYVLFRIFIFVLPGPFPGLNALVAFLSIMTMLIGVFGAIGKSTIKGILSYHIISQIGYMTLALSLYTPVAIASALLFTIHNIWVKVSLFLIGGEAERIFETGELKKMGNLSSLDPWLGAAFLVQAFSLAGLPPLSGFLGKYLIVSESLRLENYFGAAIALLTSWFTLVSMLKIWNGAFWKGLDFELPENIIKKGARSFSIGLLVLASLLLAFFSEPAYEAAQIASLQIFKKEAYIEAIFQTKGKGRSK